MVVNPRKVASGWALRWPKEAFQLMSRAWILWMGTAALLAVACELLVDMGILRLLFWVIGLFVMLLSTGFARLSDHKFVTGRDIVDNFQSSFRLLLDDMMHRRLAALAAIVFYLIGNYYTHDAEGAAGLVITAAAAPPSPSTLLSWLLQPKSPLSDAGMAMFAGCILPTGGYIFPGMAGCFRQAFGDIDRKVLASLLNKAAHQNKLPIATLAVFNFAIGFLAVTVPVVGWVLGVFMPLLCYVAFREIFVDGDGNRKRVPRTVTNSLSNTVANAA
jgi:hypothetical protein